MVKSPNTIQYNICAVKSIGTASVVVDTFDNKSHKTRSSNDIDHDKMVALEARIMAIKGV